MDSDLVGKEGSSTTGCHSKGGAKVVGSISNRVNWLDEDGLCNDMKVISCQLSFDSFESMPSIACRFKRMIKIFSSHLCYHSLGNFCEREEVAHVLSYIADRKLGDNGWYGMP